VTARRGEEGAVDQDVGHCVVMDARWGRIALVVWEVRSM